MKINEILHDDENYYISSEICVGGELFDRLIDVKKFGERKAATIIE